MNKNYSRWVLGAVVVLGLISAFSVWSGERSIDGLPDGDKSLVPRAHEPAAGQEITADDINRELRSQFVKKERARAAARQARLPSEVKRAARAHEDRELEEMNDVLRAYQAAPERFEVVGVQNGNAYRADESESHADLMDETMARRLKQAEKQRVQRQRAAASQ
jgi:hypothetical protein